MGRHLVGVVIGSLSMTLACVSPNLVGTALAFSCITGSTTVCTFEAVSAAEEFAVPATANSFTVTAVGGAGGQGFKNINNVPGGDGGNGAQVSAAFTNMAGKILKVLVAGNGGSSDGSTAGAGGFNLGGTGGTEAGGGGGASELDICATYPSNCPTRLLVAGGAGGGGAGSPTGVGGSGDGSTSVATPGAGSAGGNYGCDILNTTIGGGGGATQASAGTGGVGAGAGSHPGSDGGAGGAGGDDTSLLLGGGGGGGYTGGGGGGDDVRLNPPCGGGGGAGSSFVDSSFLDGSATSPVPNPTYATSNSVPPSGCTSLPCIVITFPGPTVATYASLTLRHSDGWTTMRWTSLERFAGYNVYSRKLQLNRHLVVSRNHRYAFTVHRIVRHPRLVPVRDRR